MFEIYIYIYIISLLYAYHSACHIVASLKVFLHGPRPPFKKRTDSHGVWDNALILARSPCGNIPISKHICICTICACILFRIKCKPTTDSPWLLHLAQVGPRIPARALELEETGPEWLNAKCRMWCFGILYSTSSCIMWWKTWSESTTNGTSSHGVWIDGVIPIGCGRIHALYAHCRVYLLKNAKLDNRSLSFETGRTHEATASTGPCQSKSTISAK